MSEKELHTNMAIFTVLFKAAVEQSYTIHGKVGHTLKQWSNRFFNTGNSYVREMESFIQNDKSSVEQYDILTDYLHEVVKQAMVTPSKDKFLALITSFNAGEIQIDFKEEAA